MTFETLKFAIGAIAALAVLCIAVVYLGRFLSWIERSEIARQKAEAAGGRAQEGRRARCCRARTRRRPDPTHRRHRGCGRRLRFQSHPYRGSLDRARLGVGGPLDAPDVASHALTRVSEIRSRRYAAEIQDQRRRPRL